MTLQPKTLFALGLAILTYTASGAASPQYPAYVENRWDLSRRPDCILCHQTQKGGAHTVTTPFGNNLESRGAKGKNNQSALIRALDAVGSEGDDSDRDGASDYFELVSGADPNDANDAPIASGAGGEGSGGVYSPGDLGDLPPPAGYGCAMQRGRSNLGAVGLAFLAIGLLARRRSAASRV